VRIVASCPSRCLCGRADDANAPFVEPGTPFWKK
jgi:hypothetical protein